MLKQILLILILLCYIVSDSSAFIENKGQWKSDVLFLHTTPKANYWIFKDKIVYDSYFIRNYSEDSLKIDGFSSNLIFKGISPDARLSYSSLSKKTVLGKTIYDTLIISNLYPNIDIRYTDSDGHLRFDFLCNDKSDPTNIKLSSTESEVKAISNSKFAFQKNNYSLIVDSLKTYTYDGRIVPSAFAYNGESISVEIKNLPEEEYIIDPIIYSTFLGGSSYEYARDVAVFNSYIYTVGYTSSKNFPVKEGAYTEFLKESEAGEVDIIISKFNSKGDSLLSSTYFGSYFNDYAESICIDSLGHVYIAGYFESNTTFPITTESADTTFGEGYEGFIACFDSNLTNLKYSTLISGQADDFPQKIHYIHAQKEIAACGYTYSKNTFPASKDKHLAMGSDKADAFLMSFTTDLSKIKESAVWGGSDDDFCHDFIQTGSIITTVGYSLSNNFPLKNANTPFDLKKDSIYGDAFITQINLDAREFEKSIIFSGIKKDIAYSISAYNDSLFSIAGYTESIDFPVTPDAYDIEYSNGISETKGDAFVAKFDINLIPIYISFYGGAETDRAFDCGHDSNGNTYIIGSTYSTDFPVKGPYINRSFADTSGNSDAFIAKIKSSGDKLLYSTYLGGSKIDIAKAIYVQRNNYAVVTGWTSSPDFPVKGGSLDTTHNNNNMADIFSLKILPSRIEYEEGNEIYLCDVDTIDINTVLYDFDVIDTTYWQPDYNISDLETISTTVFPDSSTKYTLFVRDTTGFIDSASIEINIISFPEKQITGLDKVKPDVEYEYKVSDKPYITFDWHINAGEILSKVDSNSITVKWDNPYEGYLKLYYLTDYGCKDSTELFTVTYDTVVKPHITPITKTKVCKGQPVIFDAGAGYKAYQWSTGSTSRFDTVYSAGLYWAVLKDNNDVIHFTDSVFVILLPLPQIPSVIVNGNILTSSEEDLFYQWYRNGLAIPGAISKSYTALESGFFQVELKNKNNCINRSDSTFVTVTSVLEESDTFYLEFHDDNLRVDSFYPFDLSIYNIMGEEIYSSEALKTLYLNISDFPPGLYFSIFTFHNLNSQRVYKLLKY